MTPDPLLIERLALALIDRLEALPERAADPDADRAAVTPVMAADGLAAAASLAGTGAAAVSAAAAAGFDDALAGGSRRDGVATADGWPLPPPLPRRGRVVLVSSARAGEGKSFVAGLLHAALSSQPPYADSVALLDSQRLAGPRLPGVRDGRLPVAASALLFQPAAVREALAELRQRHAVTLVDGVLLADCGALAREADAVVLVVDARRTPRRSIERALAASRIDPTRLAGVVLNRREPGLPGWLGAD